MVVSADNAELTDNGSLLCVFFFRVAIQHTLCPRDTAPDSNYSLGGLRRLQPEAAINHNCSISSVK